MDFNLITSHKLYDAVVVGGGPTGLSAAMRMASEDLGVLVLESDHFGGQAATSSKIWNYAGFPQGIPGPELTRRFVRQARAHGAELRSHCPVVELEYIDDLWLARCESGEQFWSRTVLLATGMRCRRMTIPGADGCRGLVYHARPNVLSRHAGKPVAVIGSANSAGQAALFLESIGCQVTILARHDLSQMSCYLVDAIRASDITVLEGTEVTAVADTASGSELLLSSGSRHRVAAGFVFIGAQPVCPNVVGGLTTDEEGYVRSDTCTSCGVSERRGLFVAGDLRADAYHGVQTGTADGVIAAGQVWDLLRGRHAHTAPAAIPASPA